LRDAAGLLDLGGGVERDRVRDGECAGRLGPYLGEPETLRRPRASLPPRRADLPAAGLEPVPQGGPQPLLQRPDGHRLLVPLLHRGVPTLDGRPRRAPGRSQRGAEEPDEDRTAGGDHVVPRFGWRGWVKDSSIPSAGREKRNILVTTGN